MIEKETLLIMKRDPFKLKFCICVKLSLNVRQYERGCLKNILFILIYVFPINKRTINYSSMNAPMRGVRQ